MSDNEIQLTTKADTNLSLVLNAKARDIMAVAAPNVREDGAWLTRARLELLSKPDTANLMTTKKGVESALTAIIKAATVGINFGGTKPQAYFVPTDGGIRMDVTQFGYAHAAVYGPGAVLAHVPELIKVHENDGTRIDQSTGSIHFQPGGIDPFKDRGKLMGYVMRLEFKDGRAPQVHAIALTKVKEIQAKYGNQNSPAYKKSPDEMDEKTAVKQLLKRAYAEAEGLSQTGLGMLDDDEPPAIERDPVKRMADRLDKAASGMKAAEPSQTVDDVPEDVAEVVETVEPVEEKKDAPADLF